MAASGKRCSFTADLDQLKTCFEELDAGDRGHINYEQLRRLVERLPALEESVVPDLWQMLDSDGDEKVKKKKKEEYNIINKADNF